MKLKSIHHIAIITSDYHKSKKFYAELLGLKSLNEVYRAERGSYMLDLALDDGYTIELFSFPDPPKRPTYPEACWLCYLVFAVDSVADTLKEYRPKASKQPNCSTTPRPASQRRFSLTAKKLDFLLRVVSSQKQPLLCKPNASIGYAKTMTLIGGACGISTATMPPACWSSRQRVS
jgi:glyoxylase I family protein